LEIFSRKLAKSLKNFTSFKLGNKVIEATQMPVAKEKR